MTAASALSSPMTPCPRACSSPAERPRPGWTPRWVRCGHATLYCPPEAKPCLLRRRPQASSHDMLKWAAIVSSHGAVHSCAQLVPSSPSPSLSPPAAALLSEAFDACGQRALQAWLLHQDQPPTELDSDGGSDNQHAERSDAACARRAHALLQQAKACWARRGHPGWALLPLETAAFEQGCGHLREVLLPASVAAAAVPQTPHGGTSLAPAADPTAAAWQLAGSMAAGFLSAPPAPLSAPPPLAAEGMTGLSARPAAVLPAEAAGGALLSGSLMPDRGSGGAGTGQPGEIVQEFAALGMQASCSLLAGALAGEHTSGVDTDWHAMHETRCPPHLPPQSPLSPGSLSPSPPPTHAMASSPFDVVGAAPVTPGIPPLPAGVARHAGPAAAGASLTARVLYSLAAQPQPRMVPVAPSSAAVGTSVGGAVPLHVQLAGGTAPSLQPRSSDESLVETSAFADEPSLTPPQPAAAAVRVSPASPDAPTPESASGGAGAAPCGGGEAGPDLAPPQLVRAAGNAAPGSEHMFYSRRHLCSAV